MSVVTYLHLILVKKNDVKSVVRYFILIVPKVKQRIECSHLKKNSLLSAARYIILIVVKVRQRSGCSE